MGFRSSRACSKTRAGSLRVAAISTGLFSLPQATGTFLAIVACEIAFGVAVGWVSLRLRHYSRDPQVEITLSLLTPYVAYWIPEHLGGSGVIATVLTPLRPPSVQVRA